MRALVVDDSRAMRLVIGRILGDLGFTVTDASDGKAGLECAMAGPPFDVVLLDWNMPTMNGYELLQALRANPAFNAMPVVMVTTETEISQMARALEAGANEYVMKPFTKDALRDKLSLLHIAPS